MPQSARRCFRDSDAASESARPAAPTPQAGHPGPGQSPPQAAAGGSGRNGRGLGEAATNSVANMRENPAARPGPIQTDFPLPLGLPTRTREPPEGLARGRPRARRCRATPPAQRRLGVGPARARWDGGCRSNLLLRAVSWASPCCFSAFSRRFDAFSRRFLPLLARRAHGTSAFSVREKAPFQPFRCQWDRCDRACRCRPPILVDHPSIKRLRRARSRTPVRSQASGWQGGLPAVLRAPARGQSPRRRRWLRGGRPGR